MAYSIKKHEVIKYQPEELENFYLYIFEWIDNLHFALDPHIFLDNADDYIKKAEKLFKKAQWKGDGTIQLIWIPPFMFCDLGFGSMAQGFVVWHVKQVEDGISFILSPERLQFLD
nr:hypothetical protein [uncultured Flavobacterium sp.]